MKKFKILNELLNPLLKVLKKSLWLQIIIILLILMILAIIFNSNNKTIEGFTFMDKYSEKTNNDIFDDFYSNIYDDLLFSELKNDFEIEEVLALTNKTKNTNILDIGCGTGKHISDMKSNGLNVTGLDKSEAMVEIAKKNNPDVNIKLGDALNSMIFNEKEFTHITCFYFTIYYIKNKKQFLSNCYNWLKPGGSLILHLVNRDKFNPIVPAGDPFVIVSPQKYAKERITKSSVVFNDFDYKCEFIPVNSENISTFKENFKDRVSGNIRSNMHTLYMETQKSILEIAKSIGFIELAQIDMSDCQYDHQYLYVLQRPN
jgi:SAM-dependent methyltransferase